MTTQKEKQLKKEIAVFETSTIKKSVWQLINTFVPFILLWIFAYKSLSISYALSLALCLINVGFVVRMFIIFHDCCHHSFFKNRKANKIVGTIMGILTFFPYNQWQHSHSIHHATSGNLDKRGTGDIWVLTMDEYAASSKWRRLAYRTYRNPFVMFVIGPIYVFLLQQRFNKKGARKNERMNTYFVNLSIVSIITLCCWTIGWKDFLIIHGPIFLLSGSLGIWLFYVQHQFEDTYFESDKEWEYVKAAVEGSSFYKLPKILQWITGNIGFHHIHHLSPRVPNYHLEAAHNHHEPLQKVPTITLRTSLKSLNMHLWDENKKQFISFKENKRILSKQKA